MFGVSRVPELIVLLIVILLIVGPGKLPQVGRGFGEMIRGFKRTANEDEQPAEETTARKA